MHLEQVSAVTQEGMDDLLETLVLQAEVLELRADGEVTFPSAEFVSLYRKCFAMRYFFQYA